MSAGQWTEMDCDGNNRPQARHYGMVLQAQQSAILYPAYARYRNTRSLHFIAKNKDAFTTHSGIAPWIHAIYVVRFYSLYSQVSKERDVKLTACTCGGILTTT